MTEQWLSTVCKKCNGFIARGFTSPLPVTAEIVCNHCHAVREYQTDEMTLMDK
jgi:RNase P subunit RPR2